MRSLWEKTARWTFITMLLRERRLLQILGGLGALYLLLSLFEVSIWSCPWREYTGWHCPGCGLTTGCKAILRGHLMEGVSWNWLAPFALLGFLLMGIVLAVPPPLRVRLLAFVESVESRFRLVLIASLLLVIQTIARILGSG